MKKIVALFLLTVAVGIAFQWRSPAAPTPIHHTIEPASGMIPAPAQPQSHRPTQLSPPSETVSRLPASFAETQVDGRLRTDAQGGLIIDGDVRRVFDYFLASIGEESLEASVTRLRGFVERELPQPAEGQALQVLGQYLDYKRQLLILEQDHAQQADLNTMRERLNAVRQLRAGIFGDQVHQTFFGLEEAADRFTLEKLAIRRDPTLDAAAKGAAIDRLQDRLPAELLDTLVVQLQVQLREQTQALQASNGTREQLRQLRQQLVGNAATERLERLDNKRQQWQERLAAYLDEKARIEKSRGLGEVEKRTALARMAAKRFDENERKRLAVVERSLTQRSD